MRDMSIDVLLLSKPSNMLHLTGDGSLCAYAMIIRYAVTSIGNDEFRLVYPSNVDFSMNDEENYWNCFIVCGGGSVIDFWTLWRKKNGLDAGFAPTITDLASMLF